jgi:hypothetical protein
MTQQQQELGSEACVGAFGAQKNIYINKNYLFKLNKLSKYKYIYLRWKKVQAWNYQHECNFDFVRLTKF